MDEPGADATARSARLRHLIITVYGLYARHDGGWLSVATLIRLLADLGIDEPAVRSAISRLKRRGILQSRRHDGAAGYQLSAGALAILREGDARIFRRGRATPADGWVLAVFSVPESERHRRHVLRSELTRLGFGMVAPGVWIVPAHPQDTTAETLRRLELDAYADLFRADHLAFYEAVGERATLVAGEALAGADAATTLRHVDGAPVLTEGPFAQTAEVVGGFYLVDAANLDVMTSLCELLPKAYALEIRPVVPIEGSESR